MDPAERYRAPVLRAKPSCDFSVNRSAPKKNATFAVLVCGATLVCALTVLITT